MPSCRGSSRPRDQTHVSMFPAWQAVLYHSTTRDAQSAPRSLRNSLLLLLLKKFPMILGVQCSKGKGVWALGSQDAVSATLSQWRNLMSHCTHCQRKSRPPHASPLENSR